MSRFARDPLLALATHRRALIENKSRDFAAERAPNHPWPAESTTVRALSDGKPQRMRSREDYNADERRYAHHTLQFRYRQARQRALIGAPLYDLAFREELIRQRRRPAAPAFDFNEFANAVMAGDQRGIERALGVSA